MANQVTLLYDKLIIINTFLFVCQVLQYVDKVIPTVRTALCDPLPEVRACAAQTFNNLYKTIGVRALNDIIPNLLEKLVSKKS